MAFHEDAIFPLNISRGSRGGPGFRHSVLTLDSGDESAVPRWPTERRTYNARYGVKRYEQIQTVHDFYLGRNGISNGFRWFDLFDHSTAANHRDAPAGADTNVGQGDGATVIFQSRKLYTSVSQTSTRTIQKPIDNGTFRVELSGVPQAETTDYTVDYSTGEFQFITPPVGGGTPDQVTMGCEYHVPVKFGEELDDVLDVSHRAFESGDIPDIPIVEIPGDASTPEQPYRGGSSFQSIGIATMYDFAMGALVVWFPTMASLFVTLPALTDLDDGPSVFHFVNGHSTNSLDFRNRSNGNLEFTLAAGIGAMVGIRTTAGGVKNWIAFQGV